MSTRFPIRILIETNLDKFCSLLRQYNEYRGRLKIRDWNYRHQTAGVENAGPSSYGKPKHLRVLKCRSYFLLVTAHTK